jgi:diguanylate cyclase (GGDEF)-like protein/PAS domain S-box-containing protein
MSREGQPALAKNAGGVPSWRRAPAVAAVLIVGSLLAVVIVAVATVHILTQHDTVIANHQRELKNTALIMAENTDQNFTIFDKLLVDLTAKFRHLDFRSKEELAEQLATHRFHLEMKTALVGIPFVTQLGVVDQNGDLVSVSSDWPAPPVNIRDREHFRILRTAENDAPLISTPVYSRLTNQWVIAFARRIVDARGEFRGVIGGAVDLAFFERFFESVTLEADSTITLIRMDGTLLARHPRKESMVGRPISNPRSMANFFGGAEHREVRAISPLDGEERIMSIRKLANFPVAIGVSIAAKTALADWRRESVFVGALAAAAVLAIALGAFVSIRHLARTQSRTDREIGEHKARLGMALDNMSQGLCMFDENSNLILCNQRYLEMYSLPPDIVKSGCSLEQIIEERKKTNTFEGDTHAYLAEIGALVARGNQVQRLVETPDGRVIRLVHQPMPDGAWVATHEDITVQRRAEQERDRNREFLNLVVDNIPVTTLVKDAKELRYVFVNRAGEKYYGTTREKMIGRTPFDLLPGPSAQLITDLDRQLLAANRGPIEDEHQIRMADGNMRVAKSSRLPILDEKGEPQYLLTVIEDITERKRQEERIAHLAHHDALTNLPNRVLFRSQLEMAMSQLREGEHLALLYLDVDHFKSINDTLGHPIGDELLRAVAARLRRCVQMSDTVARLGGDEFALIHMAIRHPQDCIPLLNSIYEAIRAPFDIGGHHVVADVSIGIAIAPGDGTQPDELLKNADLALYGAKAEGRGTYRFFELDMDARMKERRTLELDLRKAITQGEFELYYQPIRNIAEDRVAGFEALLRWNHPERGIISPADFIPVAEETGLINPIGEWVLRRACADAVKWPDNLKVAVNLSPTQFRSRSLVQTIFNAFATAGLSPDRLELEITETVLMQHTETTIEMLKQLRKIGVRIAIDDFGTGFSSLGYLRSFPISKLKIDRSFIRDLPDDADAMAIVRAVVGLANSLGIVSTAEGVETEQQHEALREVGCSEMQGFLLSKPRPVGEIARFFPSAGVRSISAA